MAVINLQDYMSETRNKEEYQICFFSPAFSDLKGNEKYLNICVRVEDGDIAGIMSTVVEDGGIGKTDEDGVFHFLPWPCAAVEIQKVDSDSAENPPPTPPE